MEVSCQLHAPAALPPEKESPVPISQEVGWAPHPRRGVLFQKLTVTQLVNPKDYFRVKKSPELVHIPSQMNSIHNFSSYFSKINSNITLPFTHRYSECSFPSGLPTHTWTNFPSFPVCYMSWPSHSHWFDHSMKTVSFYTHYQPNGYICDGVSKSFWTGRIERQLQMVQLSAT